MIKRIENSSFSAKISSYLISMKGAVPIKHSSIIGVSNAKSGESGKQTINNIHNFSRISPIDTYDFKTVTWILNKFCYEFRVFFNSMLT